MLLHIFPLPPLHSMLLSTAHTGEVGEVPSWWDERSEDSSPLGGSALKIACAATHHHFPSTSPCKAVSVTIWSIIHELHICGGTFGEHFAILSVVRKSIGFAYDTLCWTNFDVQLVDTQIVSLPI